MFTTVLSSLQGVGVGVAEPEEEEEEEEEEDDEEEEEEEYCFFSNSLYLLTASIPSMTGIWKSIRTTS